ncbi:MAG: FAD-linked oxidase C-terminal domain-containing protein, partial [Pseudomonadota bacterium]
MNAPTSATALRKPLPPAFVSALQARFDERCSTAAAVREHHGRDESPFPPLPPDAVVFAQSTEDVAALVKLCADWRVPVIAFGVGSSLEGHLLAVAGGVCVDLSRMNKVLAVNPEDLTVTVQAGVTRKQLNDEIRHTGLFFPIDPGADATIGGMVATRASGTNAVRYGTMRENVLALTVVTAEGKIIRTSRRAKKSSAGYDLTRLFVGSEGTLGIVTEVTLKLYPQPEAISAATCSFPSVDAAVKTTIATIQMGVPIARCELLDALTVKAVNAHSKLGLPELPLLLFEFHGSAAGVREQAETVQQIAREHGGQDFQWATNAEDRSRLWTARHNAYFACLQLKPGARSFTTDVCVPISRLAECIGETIADLATSFLPAPILGHVGDGNFHCAILANPDDPREVDEAERLNRRIVARALAMDGTCTGEHGVGLHKMDFLIEEHGADAVDLMAR